MSFLAGLLRRELPPVPSGSPVQGGTTPAASVEPRLASRFENPGSHLLAGFENQGASDDGQDEPGIEKFVGRDADAVVWGSHSGQTGDIGMRGNLAHPAMAPAATARLGGVPESGSGRPELAKDPAALYSGNTGGNHSQGGEGGTFRPVTAATRALSPAVPVAFSAAQRLDPAMASTMPRMSRAILDGGAGRPGRQADVVHGMERTEDNHGSGGRPPGNAWQGRHEAEGVVRPRLEPLARREQARAPEQHIHVSIGRIEVRAVPALAPHRPEPERAGLMSLDEYLKDRP